MFNTGLDRMPNHYLDELIKHKPFKDEVLEYVNEMTEEK